MVDEVTQRESGSWGGWGGEVVNIRHNHGEPHGREGIPGTPSMTSQRGRRSAVKNSVMK